MKKGSKKAMVAGISEDVAPAVYTAPEMAILLRLSEWMVYDRARSGQIPADAVIQFGSQKRFLKRKINEWLGIGPDDEDSDDEA